MAGEVNGAEMGRNLEDVFGGWRARTVTASPIAATAPGKGKRLLLVDKDDATQTYFAFGSVGITRNDPDLVAISLVNTIFGGRFTSAVDVAVRRAAGDNR